MLPSTVAPAGYHVILANAMNDQAHRLRTAVSRPPATTPLPALAVTGGKGGVGKTSLAVNLAISLCRLGMRSLLVDFDLSLANADVLLGMTPGGTLFDVVQGTSTIAAVAVEGPEGLGFIPAASGRDELTRLSEAELERMVQGIAKFMHAFDIGIIDTPAGIGREVMSALLAVRAVLVVVTPDPTSITDAYALIKLLEAQSPGKDIRVVVNLSANHSEAVETYTRLRKVVNTYLKRDVALLGILPRDHAVAAAVRARRPFVLGVDGPASAAVRSMAGRLKGERWK
jgi:flagellar biosynthesis protein FlhG